VGGASASASLSPPRKSKHRRKSLADKLAMQAVATATPGAPTPTGATTSASSDVPGTVLDGQPSYVLHALKHGVNFASALPKSVDNLSASAVALQGASIERIRTLCRHLSGTSITTSFAKEALEAVYTQMTQFDKGM